MPKPSRWVGVDEAGYGPNLGPLVMSAVVAESADGRPPDIWGDLVATVERAGGDPAKLWVDDSKAIYKPGQGRDRLDAATWAVVGEAANSSRPATFSELLRALGAGSLEDAEVSLWLDDGDRPLAVPPGQGRPLSCERWKIIGARTVVVGPSRFNGGLDRHGSKAKVHFDAFAELLHLAWDLAADGVTTRLRSDKHGGRHFYYEPLLDALPDAWIDRGTEGPALSQYTVRGAGRRLELSFMPRADAHDGLVALASIVSKTVREHWMDAFNAHWLARIPGLAPTAGYPVDAARFRQAIEPLCMERSLDPRVWWRLK